MRKQVRLWEGGWQRFLRLGTHVWVGRRLAWVQGWGNVGIGVDSGALCLRPVWLRHSGYVG